MKAFLGSGLVESTVDDKDLDVAKPGILTSIVGRLRSVPDRQAALARSQI